MSYDIYGEPLRRGHCEVHPHVHEEYPCSVCLAEKRQHDQQPQYCDGNPAHCESAHYLGQAREHIDALRADNERLRSALEDMRADIQNVEASRDGYRDDARMLHAALVRLTALYESEFDHESVHSWRPQWLTDALSLTNALQGESHE